MTPDQATEAPWPSFSDQQRACAEGALRAARTEDTSTTPSIRLISSRAGFVLQLAHGDDRKLVMKVSPEGDCTEIQNEYAILRSLPPNYSTRVRSFVYTRQCAAIVLDWIEAESLSSHWSEPPRTSERARYTDLVHIATELDRLHKAEIAHGDIQPTHIRFRGEQVVLIDFGVSGAPGSTFGGGLIHYLSPEYATAILSGDNPLRTFEGDWYALLASAFVAHTKQAPVTYPKDADRYARLNAIAEGVINPSHWDDPLAQDLAVALKLPANQRREWFWR